MEKEKRADNKNCTTAKSRNSGQALMAFFTPNPMLRLNKTEVVNNVHLRDRPRQHIIMMRKNKAHLLHIITDRPWRIMFCHQHIVQLQQALLRLRRKRYLAVSVFLNIILEV